MPTNTRITISPSRGYFLPRRSSGFHPRARQPSDCSTDGIGISRACQRDLCNVRVANSSERVAKRAIALSDAELFGVLVHVVSKFCGLLSRFAHRDRDASTKVSAGLVQPFVRRAPETNVVRVIVIDMDVRS